MGRRVLTAYELNFHERNKHNPATYPPADLAGKDLADLFEDWAKQLETKDTLNESRQTWVSVAGVSRYAPRVVLLVLTVGAYGEAGELVDIDTAKSVGSIEENHAPTGTNRALLFIPERGERAYFFSEESSRGHAGGRIRELFRLYFRETMTTVTMETRPVFESEVWATAAELTEVEVRAEGRSVDIADGITVTPGKVSHIVRPQRGKRFPLSLLKRLEDERTLKRVIAVDELPTDRTVWVTLERDRRRKKFQLGADGTPPIRELLNESSEPPLETDDFVKRCVDRVSGLCERYGESWDDSWSRPIKPSASG